MKSSTSLQENVFQLSLRDSVSDLGNGGWPNSMKLGEDIDEIV